MGARNFIVKNADRIYAVQFLCYTGTQDDMDDNLPTWFDEDELVAKGATHYMPLLKNGEGIGLLYKVIPIKFNDGTTLNEWHYLTFSGAWHRSQLTNAEINQLKQL